MQSIGERIKELRKMQGADKTLEKFGARLGITAQSLSAIENGKTNPSNQTVLAICRVFGVDEIWLRTGEGQPFRGRTKDEVLAEVFARAKIGDEPRDRLIRAFARLPLEYYPIMEEILREVVSRLDPPPDTGTNPAPAKKEETP